MVTHYAFMKNRSLIGLYLFKIIIVFMFIFYKTNLFINKFIITLKLKTN